MNAVVDLTAIVKAYDVRGVVPDQLNERVAHALGADPIPSDRAEALQLIEDPSPYRWQDRNRIFFAHSGHGYEA